MTDDVSYIDAESYGGSAKDQLSFQQIVMRHLIKLGNLASREFIGGYWQDRVRAMGSLTVNDHYYVGDSREVYGNSIDFLHDILSPYFDQQMQEVSEEVEKELEKAKREILKKDDKRKKQEYKDAKVVIKRKLLRGLSAFLYREKYLSAKQFEEDV